jgi:hypothetical protein
MKPATRRTPSTGELRRTGRQVDRMRAPIMRDRYASIARLQVDLSFGASAGPAPSPQSHSFYPPARAFFRFPCPCSECDGEFDLSAGVDKLAAIRQPALRTASGRLDCEGVHYRERANASSCRLAVSWRLAIVQSE